MYPPHVVGLGVWSREPAKRSLPTLWPRCWVKPPHPLPHPHPPIPQQFVIVQNKTRAGHATIF